MKTPTVDTKPKRDKLGPTGPANIADDSDEEPKKSEVTKPKEPSYESELENILDRKRAQTPPG